MPSDVMPAESPRSESANAGLNAKQAKFCAHNATELAAHVPHPRCAWTWREVGLSRRTLGYLRHEELIEPVEGSARRWQTTRKLWRALPRYTDDASPGTVAGQVRFDAPRRAARSRIESDAPEQPRVDGQATLSGGSVPVREVREARDDGEDDEDDDAGKLGMVQQAMASGRREVPDDQQTLDAVVREVGATVETTYHPEVHRPARHPDQATLSEVSAP